jgi:hypothetical protein
MAQQLQLQVVERIRIIQLLRSRAAAARRSGAGGGGVGGGRVGGSDGASDTCPMDVSEKTILCLGLAADLGFRRGAWLPLN